MGRAIRRKIGLGFLGWALLAFPVGAFASDDLLDLSLEELMNVEVTSVSKRAQSKMEAAAAVTVISAEDIRRSGMNHVPELLRLVPGIQVARITANRWAISSRGQNEEFGPRLLVMIDGRSVYTPFFGGVYWDIQDYPLEDIARIEVIRGPGGTVWGENAVNGVINIITKQAGETQGALISGFGGNQEYGGTLRFGGQLGEKTQYRLFGRGFSQFDFDTNQRMAAQDEWQQFRTGFRIDSQPSEVDELRFSGEYYSQDTDLTTPTGVPGVFNTNHSEAQGGHFLASWNRTYNEDSRVRVQAYYDRTVREAEASAEEDRHLADLEVQRDITFRDLDFLKIGDGALVEDLDVTYGGNYRFSTSHSSPMATASVDPNSADFHIGSGFVQFTGHTWDDRLAVTLGTKLGVNNWSGFEYQPSVRLLVKPVENHVFWGAISRAVRLPTQVDRDLRTSIGVQNLVGTNDTRSEDLTAFEAGYRLTVPNVLTAELSLYYNILENARALQVINFAPVTLQFVNQGRIATRGFELEVKTQLTDWWGVTLGYAFFNVDEDFASSNVTFSRATATNPEHEVMFRQSFEIGSQVSFDATLFFVDGLGGAIPSGQAQNVESYIRLDLRAAYRPFDWMELSVVGQNLTDRRHYEFFDVRQGQVSQIPRTVHGNVRLEF